MFSLFSTHSIFTFSPFTFPHLECFIPIGSFITTSHGFCGVQGFYEYINRASVLEFLKDFLTHEDPNVRAKACSALGNMCRHNSYFYSSLVSNLVIYIFVNFVDILQINSSSGFLKLCTRMFSLDHAFTHGILECNIWQWINCAFFLLLIYIFIQARNRIIGLLIDRCDDPDKRTRKFACFAVSSNPIFYDRFFTSNTVAVEYNLFLSFIFSI